MTGTYLFSCLFSRGVPATHHCQGHLTHLPGGYRCNYLLFSHYRAALHPLLLRSPHPSYGWPQVPPFSSELPQGWPSIHYHWAASSKLFTRFIYIFSCFSAFQGCPSRCRFWEHLGCTHGDHRGCQIFPIFPTVQRRKLSSHQLQGCHHLPCGWPQGPPSAHRPSQGMTQQLLPPGTSQSHLPLGSHGANIFSPIS
jgi:hypothetical protein